MCVIQGSLNMHTEPCSDNTITVQNLKEQVKSSVCTTCQSEAALPTKPERTLHMQQCNILRETAAVIGVLSSDGGFKPRP